MAEAVKVIVRCRPMNTRERNLNCGEVVSMTSQTQCTIVNPDAQSDPPKDFTFDGAYFTDSTTEQIYNDVCFDLVENVLEGYNGTVFAYGQTGCGKSFSMQGIPQPTTQRGIIPRAFDHIFEAVAIAKDKRFLVHASYLEIYNEQVRDLLSKDAKKQLDLKEHPEKGVYVSGLSQNEVRNVEDCQLLMAKGWNNRAVGATLMNADSSRSHSIFTINIEIMDSNAATQSVGAPSAGGGEEHFLASKLNLVDLAGSERQSKTGAAGDRLKEATKINLSLSALGNVISALVDGKSKHIPYRDSKLTRLLQDSLGGNTKTLMVACLSPAADNYDETLSTLRYANRAKNIKNKPKINEDPKDALLRQYQEEIMQLKAMLDGKPLPATVTTNQNKVTSNSSGDRVKMDKEKEQIKQEYESHLRQMEQQISDLSRAKQMVEHELTSLKLKSTPNSTASQGHDLSHNRSEEGLRDPPNDDADDDPCRDEGRQGVKYGHDENREEKLVRARGGFDDDGEGELNEGIDDEEGDLREFYDDENGDCEGVQDESGNFLKVKDSGDASAFKKSPELRRKNARPKSSAPNLISISEADAEGSPRNAKNVESQLTANARPSSHSETQQNSTQRQQTDVNCVAPENQNGQGVTTEQQEAAMKRLAELEAMFNQKFIKGGSGATGSGSKQTAAGDSVSAGSGVGLQEKRLRRKRQKEKTEEERRRRQLREAAERDNMDSVVQVYDSVMNEIQDREKGEERLQRKLKAAETEIRDLTSEFELERRDYLETIRSQTKQMQLVEAILEKVQPLIQRDCNYFSLRKVKEEAKYDVDGLCWRLPEVQLIKTNLPSLGQDGQQQRNGTTGPFGTKLSDSSGGGGRGGGGGSNGYAQAGRGDNLHDNSQSHRFFDENYGIQQDDVFQNYMKPKRAQKILEQGAATRGMNDNSNSRRKSISSQMTSSGDHLGSSYRNSHQLLGEHPPFCSSSSSPIGLGMGAGTSSTVLMSPSNAFEIPNPKNVRLEKLDLNAERPFSNKSKKKKKEKTFVAY